MQSCACRCWLPIMRKLPLLVIVWACQRSEWMAVSWILCVCLLWCIQVIMWVRRSAVLSASPHPSFTWAAVSSLLPSILVEGRDTVNVPAANQYRLYLYNIFLSNRWYTHINHEWWSSIHSHVLLHYSTNKMFQVFLFPPRQFYDMFLFLVYYTDS